MRHLSRELHLQLFCELVTRQHGPKQLNWSQPALSLRRGLLVSLAEILHRYLCSAKGFKWRTGIIKHYQSRKARLKAARPVSQYGALARCTEDPTSAVQQSSRQCHPHLGALKDVAPQHAGIAAAHAWHCHLQLEANSTKYLGMGQN